MGKIVLKSTEKEEVKEEPKVNKVKLEKCVVCGKPLEAYVVSNGRRFCSDLCVAESLE